MSGWRAALMVAAGLAASWLLPRGHFPAGARPEFLVLAVTVVAARRRDEVALLLATVAGLLQDATGAAPFGSRAMTLLLVAVLAIWLAERGQVEVGPIRAGIAFLTAACAGLLGGFVARAIGELPTDPPGRELWLGALATALLALFAWREQPQARARMA